MLLLALAAAGCSDNESPEPKAAAAAPAKQQQKEPTKPPPKRDLAWLARLHKWELKIGRASDEVMIDGRGREARGEDAPRPAAGSPAGRRLHADSAQQGGRASADGVRRELRPVRARVRDARRMGARGGRRPVRSQRHAKGARGRRPCRPGRRRSPDLAPRFQGAPEDRRHAPAEPDRAPSHARGQLLRLPQPRSHLHGGRGALLVEAGMAAREEGVALLHRHRRLRGLCLPRDQDQHLSASLRVRSRSSSTRGAGPRVDGRRSGPRPPSGFSRTRLSTSSTPAGPRRRPNATACRTCAPSAGCFD